MTIIADATGFGNSFDFQVAIEKFRVSGVRITTIEMILFEWLQHCQSPYFKKIIHLLK